MKEGGVKIKLGCSTYILKDGRGQSRNMGLIIRTKAFKGAALIRRQYAVDSSMLGSALSKQKG